MSKLSMLEKINVFYTDTDVNILSLDGLDNAVIGIEENDMRLIYSFKKIIKILMKERKNVYLYLI